MPLLEIDHLGVRFGGLAALSDVSFSVDPGETVAVIGPNGAGKTTLFNVIAGRYAPSSGDVRFKGRSVAGLSPAAMHRRGVGRTFQVARPFASMTVRDNVRLAMADRRFTRPWAALALRRRDNDVEGRLTDILTSTGLAGLAGQRAGELNMGALRRLEAARALAGGPDLLLLDEPAAGIGADGIRPLARLVEDIKARGVTILLVEHNVGFALSLCERVVVLDGGRKLAEGTPEEIRGNEEVIRSYLGRSAQARLSHDVDDDKVQQ